MNIPSGIIVNETLTNLNDRVSEAVSHYWVTRQGQAEEQVASGRADQGARSAVTAAHKWMVS